MRLKLEKERKLANSREGPAVFGGRNTLTCDQGV